MTSSLTSIFYLGSLISICCLYTIRMYSSFRSSVYSASKRILSMFAFMILFQSILVVLVIYFQVPSVTMNDSEAMQMGLHRLVISVGLFGVTNVTYNVLLVSIFFKKIYQITRTVKERRDNKEIIYIHKIVEPPVIYTLCLLFTFGSSLVLFAFCDC